MDRDKKKLVFTLSLQRRLLYQHYTANLNPPLGVEDWRSTVYMINHCSLASKGQCLNCPFLQNTETKFLHKANHIHVYWFFNMKLDIKKHIFYSKPNKLLISFYTVLFVYSINVKINVFYFPKLSTNIPVHLTRNRNLVTQWVMRSA